MAKVAETGDFYYTHVKFEWDTTEIDGKRVRMLFKYWYLGKDIMAIKRLDPKDPKNFLKGKRE